MGVPLAGNAAPTRASHPGINLCSCAASASCLQCRVSVLLSMCRHGAGPTMHNRWALGGLRAACFRRLHGGLLGTCLVLTSKICPRVGLVSIRLRKHRRPPGQQSIHMLIHLLSALGPSKLTVYGSYVTPTIRFLDRSSCGRRRGRGGSLGVA